MSPNTTRAPSRVNVSASAAPCPRAPPLMSATLPASRPPSGMSAILSIHVKGFDRGRQRGHDVLQAAADAADIVLRLVGDAAARDVRDELVPAGRHQEGRVDLELEGVNARGAGAAERG